MKNTHAGGKYLAFPEGEAGERILFDLVKKFSKMDRKIQNNCAAG
jgi:hypothetical protein